MQPLTLADIAAAVDGRLSADAPPARVTGVSIDSRTIKPGELFVPIKGERFDGHTFLSEAVQKGAAAVFVQDGHDGARVLPTEVPLVVVRDTLEALQRLAAWHRTQFDGPVVAVTGSNGKTTTKDLVAAVLSQKYPVLATTGNLNTEIGMALTLLRREPDHQAIVVEMGMRGPGQIASLVRIARPAIGVVTNVSPVHIELLGSLDAVALAKQELVEGLPADGIAILNADDARVRAMAAHTRAKVLTYGLHPEAEVRAEDVQVLGVEGVAFRLVTSSGVASVNLAFPGRHNVANALAAAAVGLSCGLEVREIAAGLSQAIPSGMRMQVERLAGEIVVLNDAYNASPASMKAALQALADLPARRRIAVLGDMLELGAIADEAHRAVGSECLAFGVDRLITVGDGGQAIAEGAKAAGFTSAAVSSVSAPEEVAKLLIDEVEAGDVILVKASRGLALERVIEALRSGLEGD